MATVHGRSASGAILVPRSMSNMSVHMPIVPWSDYRGSVAPAFGDDRFGRIDSAGGFALPSTHTHTQLLLTKILLNGLNYTASAVVAQRLPFVMT